MTVHSIAFEATGAFVHQVADDGFGLRLKRTRPFDVAALVACGALGIVAVVRHSGLIWVLAFLIPACLGLLSLALIGFLRRRMQRSIAGGYAALPVPRRITIDLTHDGMRFANALASEEVAWTELTDVIEGDRVWYLRLASGVGIPVPAEAISPEARARLIAERARRRSA